MNRAIDRTICYQACRGSADRSHYVMSTVSPSAGPSRRSHPRTPVYVLVHWHNRLEEGTAAHLYDISVDGVFLVPDRGLPESVTGDDPVWIVVSADGRTETLTGIVRWRGFHPSHQDIGCGIHLDADSVATIERLFPVVRDRELADLR